MNVLQYNVLNGCQEEERFNELNNWIKTQNYDVIGFNELNDWTTEQFQKQAIEWGYKHSYLFEMESSHYRIGIISKLPILLIEATEGLFHHGLLHVEINKTNFFITHFSPHSDDHRGREAAELVKRVNSLQDERVIVMGDLNALSPQDEKFYVEEDPKQYKAIQTLLDGGLTDTKCLDSFDYSFPTSLLDITKNVEKIRIDYILVNDKLNKHKPTSSIVDCADLEKISDHYPVECYWEDN